MTGIVTRGIVINGKGRMQSLSRYDGGSKEIPRIPFKRDNHPRRRILR